MAIKFNNVDSFKNNAHIFTYLALGGIILLLFVMRAFDPFIWVIFGSLFLLALIIAVFKDRDKTRSLIYIFLFQAILRIPMAFKNTLLTYDKDEIFQLGLSFIYYLNRTDNTSFSPVGRMYGYDLYPLMNQITSLFFNLVGPDLIAVSLIIRIIYSILVPTLAVYVVDLIYKELNNQKPNRIATLIFASCYKFLTFYSYYVFETGSITFFIIMIYLITKIYNYNTQESKNLVTRKKTLFYSFLILIAVLMGIWHYMGILYGLLGLSYYGILNLRRILFQIKIKDILEFIATYCAVLVGLNFYLLYTLFIENTPFQLLFQADLYHTLFNIIPIFPKTLLHSPYYPALDVPIAITYLIELQMLIILGMLGSGIAFVFVSDFIRKTFLNFDFKVKHLYAIIIIITLYIVAIIILYPLYLAEKVTTLQSIQNLGIATLAALIGVALTPLLAFFYYIFYFTTIFTDESKGNSARIKFHNLLVEVYCFFVISFSLIIFITFLFATSDAANIPYRLYEFFFIFCAPLVEGFFRINKNLLKNFESSKIFNRNIIRKFQKKASIVTTITILFIFVIMLQSISFQNFELYNSQYQLSEHDILAMSTWIRDNVNHTEYTLFAEFLYYPILAYSFMRNPTIGQPAEVSVMLQLYYIRNETYMKAYFLAHDITYIIFDIAGNMPGYMTNVGRDKYLIGNGVDPSLFKLYNTTVPSITSVVYSTRTLLLLKFNY